jgi:hypothetical protein
MNISLWCSLYVPSLFVSDDPTAERNKTGSAALWTLGDHTRGITLPMDWIDSVNPERQVKTVVWRECYFPKTAPSVFAATHGEHAVVRTRTRHAILDNAVMRLRRLADRGTRYRWQSSYMHRSCTAFRLD